MGRIASDELTARQELVLLYCAEMNEKEGSFPALRQIGAHMGIKSTNGVNDHLRSLERKGHLGYTQYRGYNLTDLGWQYADVVGIFGRFTEDEKK